MRASKSCVDSILSFIAFLKLLFAVVAIFGVATSVGGVLRWQVTHWMRLTLVRLANRIIIERHYPLL